MERGKRHISDVESLLSDIFDGYSDSLAVCDAVEKMDDDIRYATICICISEYWKASDNTLDKVLNQFKESIENIERLIMLLKEGRL